MLNAYLDFSMVTLAVTLHLYGISKTWLLSGSQSAREPSTEHTMTNCFQSVSNSWYLTGGRRPGRKKEYQVLKVSTGTNFDTQAKVGLLDGAIKIFM